MQIKGRVENKIAAKRSKVIGMFVTTQSRWSIYVADQRAKDISCM